MSFESFIEDSLLKDFKDQFSSLNKEYLKIQHSFTKAEKAKELFERISTYLKKNWPIHIKYLLDEHKDFLENYMNGLNIDKHVLIELKRSVENEFGRVIKRFPILIEKACEQNKIPIDIKSRHPRYSFRSGFFQLEIQDKLGWAIFKDYENILYEFPCDINAFIEFFNKENDRVFNREFDGEKFIKKLRHQYLAIIKKSKKADGESIPIRRITSRLGKNEKGFRTDEFLIDLSKLLDNGPTEVDGYKIDLQQTKNIKQGLLLYGKGTKGYVGYIIFRRV